MHHRLSLRASRIALTGVAAMVLAVALASSARAASSVAGVTSWKQNAAPAGWSASENRILYNSRGADGMFDGYSANPDGSDPRCVTCTIPSWPATGANTQRGVSDVSPDGNYALLEVERGDHYGTVGSSIAEPGKGTYNDVWLAKADGSQAWPLTNVFGSGPTAAMGTMWARFDRTGTKLVWAALYAPAIFNLGYWKLQVADIVWSNGVPSLANVRTIEPQTGVFMEPYGFTPDDQHVIFTSDLGTPAWYDSQIYTIATDGTGLTRMSPADAPYGFFTNYNEFAFYTPHDDAIVYGRTVNSTSGGMDYWTMNPNGTGSQRLTYFNEPWNSASLGYTVVGGLAFDPNNPNRFIAGVSPNADAHDLNAVMVTLDSSGSGLQTQYFPSTALSTSVATAVTNPSPGFKWSAPPAPGLPPTNYGVRWTGSVTPPATGTYTYCAIADDGVRLWINGQLLIDAWYSGWQRHCGSVTQTAGVPVAIRMDMWNIMATAYGQLSWIPPSGSVTPALAGATTTPSSQPIPSSLLSPTTPAAAGSSAAATNTPTSAPGTSSTTTATKSAATSKPATVKPRSAGANVVRSTGSRQRASRKVCKLVRRTGKRAKRVCRTVRTKTATRR